MRLTVADCRADIADAAGIPSTDARVYSYLNKAVRRLLPKGKWLGTLERYRVTVADALIVWPRRFQTIEAFAVCDCPGIIRNGWFEFVSGGPGIVETDGSGSYPGNALLDREEVCAFTELTGGLISKIRVYADVAEAASATIILQGYDENDNWIRTNPGGVWQDGETVAVTSPGPTVSTKNFTKLTAVRKTATNGVVRIYEWDGVTQTALGYYEPDELNPQYRRSYVPGLENVDPLQIDVIAKLRYRPVAADGDSLLITSPPALVEEVRAQRMFEANLTQEGMGHEMLAMRYLNEQLNEYHGAGAVAVLRIQNRDTFGGAVENLI